MKDDRAVQRSRLVLPFNAVQGKWKVIVKSWDYETRQEFDYYCNVCQIRLDRFRQWSINNERYLQWFKGSARTRSNDGDSVSCFAVNFRIRIANRKFILESSSLKVSTISDFQPTIDRIHAEFQAIVDT